MKYTAIISYTHVDGSVETIELVEREAKTREHAVRNVQRFIKRDAEKHRMDPDKYHLQIKQDPYEPGLVPDEEHYENVNKMHEDQQPGFDAAWMYDPGAEVARLNQLYGMSRYQMESIAEEIEADRAAFERGEQPTNLVIGRFGSLLEV